MRKYALVKQIMANAQTILMNILTNIKKTPIFGVRLFNAALVSAAFNTTLFRQNVLRF